MVMIFREASVSGIFWGDIPVLAGDGGKEILRVRMFGCREYIVCCAKLNDPAQLHHRECIADLGRDTQIVRNGNHSQVEFLTDIGKKS